MLLSNFQEKENERITNITNQDTQGDNKTIDLATYAIPTAGQTGFSIHNDARKYRTTTITNSRHNAPGAGKGEGGGYASRLWIKSIWPEPESDLKDVEKKELL